MGVTSLTNEEILQFGAGSLAMDVRAHIAANQGVPNQRARLMLAANSVEVVDAEALDTDILAIIQPEDEITDLEARVLLEQLLTAPLLPILATISRVADRMDEDEDQGSE